MTGVEASSATGRSWGLSPVGRMTLTTERGTAAELRVRVGGVGGETSEVSEAGSRGMAAARRKSSGVAGREVAPAC